MLTFRDWLRADPAARAEYQEFKRSLARPSGKTAHVDDYSRAKRTWINSAVNRAEYGLADGGDTWERTGLD